MDEAVVRMQAQMYVLVAEMNAIIVSVESMKAANTERKSHGYALAYSEEAFVKASEDLYGEASALENHI